MKYKALALSLALSLIGLAVPAPKEAKAAIVAFTCTPNQSSSYASTVLVKCTTAFSGSIFYFGFSGSTSADTARVGSLITSALLSGRNLLIDLDDNSAANPSECHSSNCRKIHALHLQ
jgi:hypothetical protein